MQNYGVEERILCKILDTLVILNPLAFMYKES